MIAFMEDESFVSPDGSRLQKRVLELAAAAKKTLAAMDHMAAGLNDKEAGIKALADAATELRNAADKFQ